MRYETAIRVLIDRILETDPEQFMQAHVCIARETKSNDNFAQGRVCGKLNPVYVPSPKKPMTMYFVKPGQVIDETSHEPLLYRSVLVVSCVQNYAEPATAVDIRVLKSRWSNPGDYVISEHTCHNITQI